MIDVTREGLTPGQNVKLKINLTQLALKDRFFTFPVFQWLTGETITFSSRYRVSLWSFLEKINPKTLQAQVDFSITVDK